MKKILVLAAFLATSAFAADAVDSAMNDKVAGSDGSSGCGLGWQVMPDKTLLASSIRNTTNQTASNTIAMTMGTSGCDKHDIVLKEKAQEHFTNVNYESIVAEMAEGRGEYLTAFAGVMGCNAASFNASTQANLEGLVGNNGSDLLKNVKAQISSNPAACL